MPSVTLEASYFCSYFYSHILCFLSQSLTYKLIESTELVTLFDYHAGFWSTTLVINSRYSLDDAGQLEIFLASLVYTSEKSSSCYE